jgi:hypothetical protein
LCPLLVFNLDTGMNVVIPLLAMSTRKRYTFFIDLDLEAALKALKARDGMPESEACRRALAGFLEKKGVLKRVQADRRRAATRRQS